MFNVFEQPWTLLITAIVGWFILLLIHGDSRLWWQSHLVIFLAVAAFAVGFLVRVGLFKISNTMIVSIQVVLCLAIAVLLTFQIIHIIQTYERHRWQWFVPIALAVAAFGFDFIVKTDSERIDKLISVARRFMTWTARSARCCIPGACVSSGAGWCAACASRRSRRR